MSSQSASPPLVILLGLACLAGGAALVWWSSPATMRLMRADGDVTVTIEARLAGVVGIENERIDRVRGVRLVRSRTPGSRSHTPDHIEFDTTAGVVNVGRLQQLFARDFSDINAFVEDQAQRAASLSSVARSEELRRFIVAQLATLFLFVVGLGVVWMGVKMALNAF